LKIVPSHLAALLTCAHPEQVLPRLRLILGGEASSWELIEKVGKLAPDCMVFNHYGPTETTVGVLTHRVTGAERPKAIARVPLGKPISNTRIYLLDPKSRPVPIGVAGELYVAGAGLARGYLNQAEATAGKFVPDSFADEPGSRLYKTGDLARRRPDGTMEFLGRVDHQVKIRGFRVEPGEIESLLDQHASVRKTVVVAREETPGEKRLVAYVVPRTKTALAVARGADSHRAPAPDGQAVSPAELRRFLSQKLPDHMIPSAFVLLNDLPLTSNGKINLRALPEPGQTRAGLEEEYEAPRNCIEEIIAGIWSQVMGVERIGVHDNFFELGGHSLLATQVIAWVREEFQIEVPLRVLFEGATVAHMAEAIRANEPVPGQAERIARVLLKVAAMPDGNEAEASL
jgi:acyl-coenzyme A synthetase/AMP-(fatty) acid ligase